MEPRRNTCPHNRPERLCRQSSNAGSGTRQLTEAQMSSCVGSEPKKHISIAVPADSNKFERRSLLLTHDFSGVHRVITDIKASAAAGKRAETLVGNWLRSVGRHSLNV